MALQPIKISSNMQYFQVLCMLLSAVLIYLQVMVFDFRRIRRISMEEALKNVI